MPAARFCCDCTSLMNAKSSKKAFCCFWKSVRSQSTCCDSTGDRSPDGVDDPDCNLGDSSKGHGDMTGDCDPAGVDVPDCNPGDSIDERGDWNGDA